MIILLMICQIRSRNVLQIYAYMAILSLNFIRTTSDIRTLAMAVELPEDMSALMTGHLTIQVINLLIFVVTILLSFPLKRQLGWDLYTIAGADVSHISMLLLINTRNVAHISAIPSGSEDFSSCSSPANAKLYTPSFV